jgi:hypothetical protein
MVLKTENIENYSGVKLPLKGCVPSLRKGYWKELNFFPGGDAPKNFIALYDYEEDSGIRRSNSDTWSRYIAKVGQKWYPIESINEYLFNQIGEVLDLNMASSRLMMAGEQLRFLSKYFLEKNESLEHGAQIFAGYMSDLQFVEKVEEQGLARTFFTFQFAEKAICHTFPNEAELILINFVKLLVFDALTGNNDRHFYNWGVIKHIESKKIPTFAPIYDSARGLFWNDSESKLQGWQKHPEQIDDRIKKYAEGSKPKTGWEGLEDLNHFELIDRIFSTDSRYKEVCSQLITQDNLQKVLRHVEINFSKFYTPLRLELIKRCLKYRFERLIMIVNKKEG